MPCERKNLTLVPSYLWASLTRELARLRRNASGSRRRKFFALYELPHINCSAPGDITEQVVTHGVRRGDRLVDIRPLGGGNRGHTGM
jgi:hypothetical protein